MYNCFTLLKIYNAHPITYDLMHSFHISQIHKYRLFLEALAEGTHPSRGMTGSDGETSHRKNPKASEAADLRRQPMGPGAFVPRTT